MANRTITATLVNNGPVEFRQGLNFAYSTYNFANVSVSNTLCIQMIPLPHRARVIDLFVTLYDRTDGVYTVGDNSLTNRFMTVLSCTADGQTNFMNAPHGAGYIVSLTASDENLFYPISVFTTTATASASTTGCIHMGVYYLMEPNVS